MSRRLTKRQRTWRWYKRRPTWLRRAMAGVVSLCVLAASLAFWVWAVFGRQPMVQPEDIVWGVTYSPLAAEELKLNPDKTYEAIVHELKPQRLRLVAYWSRIERDRGKYDFAELDKQVKLAEEKDIPYVIAVGRRVPRYPECHVPGWAKDQDEAAQQAAITKLVQATIERYNDNERLFAWQIENEPFVGTFGDCPPIDEKFLKAEVDLARSLSTKPIWTTESGELSVWFKASKYPDVLGTTLYRAVLVGQTSIKVQHVFPPWYYRARSNIAKWLHRQLESVVVAELQGEPWSTRPIAQTPKRELDRTMNPRQFERNIDFTEQVGFPEVYFWGAEWWYREKANGRNFYWERAKELFR